MFLYESTNGCTYKKKIGAEHVVELASAPPQLTAFYFKVEQVETEECFEMPKFSGIFTMLLNSLERNL